MDDTPEQKEARGTDDRGGRSTGWSRPEGQPASIEPR